MDPYGNQHKWNHSTEDLLAWLVGGLVGTSILACSHIDIGNSPWNKPSFLEYLHLWKPPYKSLDSILAGWWFGTFCIFPLILGISHHPNCWRTPSFFSGEKPPTRDLVGFHRFLLWQILGGMEWWLMIPIEQMLGSSMLVITCDSHYKSQQSI